MQIELTAATQEFAAKSVQTIIDKCYRTYQSETTDRYQDLLTILNQGTTTLNLTQNQFNLISFAALNADKLNIHWHTLINALSKKGRIYTEALTIEEIIAKDRKPIFVTNINEWGLVHITTQSREEPGLPYVKGIDFDYDIIMRGLQCLTYEP